MLIVEADISTENNVARLVAQTTVKAGRLDILVNNAGVVAQADVGSLSSDDWRKVMATDLDGVFYTSRVVIPHLEASKGSIINVSSVSGTGGDCGPLTTLLRSP